MRDTDCVPAGPRLRDVEFSSGDVVLAGWLAVPVRDEALAGVVLAGGPEPSDRDNATYFPPIRGHLADAGIAVLSRGKRGVGSSSGDWLDPALDDRAADAAAALGFLCAQPGVRAGTAGLLGHSEGGSSAERTSWCPWPAAPAGSAPRHAIPAGTTRQH
jgi:hypothetical protein